MENRLWSYFYYYLIAASDVATDSTDSFAFAKKPIFLETGKVPILKTLQNVEDKPFTGRETVLWLFTGKIDSHLGPNGMGPLPSLRFQCCVCSCRKLSLSAVDVATFADVIPNHNFSFKSFQAISFNENWGVSYAHKFPFRSGSGQAIGKAVHGRTSIEVIRPKHG